VLHFCDYSFFFSPVKRTVKPADLPVEQPIKFELLVSPALHSHDGALLDVAEPFTEGNGLGQRRSELPYLLTNASKAKRRRRVRMSKSHKPSILVQGKLGMDSGYQGPRSQ
jgi:hypothetical protein